VRQLAARRHGVAVGPTLALVLVLLAPPGRGQDLAVQQGETGGISVTFALAAIGASEAPAAGHDVAFTFTLATGANRTPLRGARPAAWLVRSAPGASVDERRCNAEAAALVGGTTLAIPALDLNAFYVLSLSDDAGIEVTDPRIGFSGSRLIGLVTLDAPGSDWAVSRNRGLVAVAEPAANEVALVDATDWSIKAKIPLPRPDRLVLALDERLLLSSYRVDDGDEGVAIIDLAAPETAPLRIFTGTGVTDIASDREGHLAFVSGAQTDIVSIIDLSERKLVGAVATGHRPVMLAYSPLARRVYAAAADGTVTAIGGPPPAVLATIAGPPGIAALRFVPGGRFALATSPADGVVAVIDAATDRIVQSLTFSGEPDAIAFSDHVAYIRHRLDEFVEAMPLEQIGVEGSVPNVIRVGAGQLSLGATQLPARADAMAPVPNGDGLMIANPGDRAIYYYREGMAAPAGSFATYREPRAVAVIDRSLRETEPGIYRTIGRLPRAGSYDVVLYLDSPRAVYCFGMRVDGDANGGIEAAAPPQMRDLALGAPPLAGHELPLRFRLVDPESGAPVSGLADVRVLSFRVPGSDASRSRAVPSADGTYEGVIVPPRPGAYYVFVEAPSVALAPTAGRLVMVGSAP
jgi:hypothetical protein